MKRTITLGSRLSRLARWQTGYVLGLLKRAWPDLDFQVLTLVTEGDRSLERPLPEIGGKGVFTLELESALRSGQVDCAVHSLKDLPIDPAAGLCIGAVSKRADAHDVLVSTSGNDFAGLKENARVGTSSLRRQAQLLAARPDLVVQPVRGNIDTRLRKALQGDIDAVVLAAAGMERLELGEQVTQLLPFELMLPAPGQGALAVQCRADDPFMQELLRPVHDDASFRAVTAERAFLKGLGGGCSAPVAAHAEDQGGMLQMDALAASPDGKRVLRLRGAGADPEELGDRLAREALTQGAGDLLA